MQIQDKVQNWNQGMTREALILAKANGTLRSLGVSDEEPEVLHMQPLTA